MSSRRGNGHRLCWSLLLSALLIVSEVTAVEDERPSMELLEFLGSWETKDGGWLDPVSMLSALQEEAEAKTQQGQTEGKQND